MQPTLLSGSNSVLSPSARQQCRRWRHALPSLSHSTTPHAYDQTSRISCSTSAPVPADQPQPAAPKGFNIHPVASKALSTVALTSILQVCHLVVPKTALASEVLTGSAFELFEQFIAQIEALGPWGPVLFIATVMVAEMIPLFPTQPLSLASGLLFGAQKGAFIVAIGATLAAFNAYQISKGVGRPLAERIIKAEMGHEGESSSGVAKQLQAVQDTIQHGSFWKQFTAILLLRLTPVVPYSASNYVLGLTPVSVPAYVGGTFIGVSVWGFVYASLGGASRKLLERGVKMDVLFADLAEKSSRYTADIAKLALAAGLLGAGIWAVYSFLRQRGQGEQQQEQQQQQVLATEEGPSGVAGDVVAYRSVDAEEVLPNKR